MRASLGLNLSGAESIFHILTMRVYQKVVTIARHEEQDGTANCHDTGRQPGPMAQQKDHGTQKGNDPTRLVYRQPAPAMAFEKGCGYGIRFVCGFVRAEQRRR